MSRLSVSPIGLRQSIAVNAATEMIHIITAVLSSVCLGYVAHMRYGLDYVATLNHNKGILKKDLNNRKLHLLDFPV